MIRKRNIIVSLSTIFLMALIFVAFNSKSTSPLFGYRYIDSDIFRYMGYSLLQGKIPYTDLFDHKGILLYWINALGYCLHSEFGIFVLQIIHLAATLFVWYRILDNQKHEWKKYLILVISLIGLSAFYEEGNLAEEWSLFFISMPFLLWLDTIKNKTSIFSRKDMIIIGLCLGALFLLRMNNMVPVIMILLYCLAEALWGKKYLYVKDAILFISTGFIIFPLIACIYMFINNGGKGIIDMFYAMIGFNLDYAKDSGLGYHVFLNNFWFMTIPLIPVLSLLPYFKKSAHVVTPIILSFFLTAFTIGGGALPHYFIALIPFLPICLTYPSHNRVKLSTAICVVIISTSVILGSHFTYLKMFPKDRLHESFLKAIESIPETKRNEIWNWGGANLTRDFIKAKIVQQNRMILSFQLGISDKLYNEEKNKIQSVKPEYVIYAIYSDQSDNNVQKYSKRNNFKESDSDYQFLVNNYDLISSVKREDESMLYCYRLKSNDDTTQTDNN